MRTEDFLSVAEKIFASEFPNAACGFVTGSVVSGQQTPSSDIDMVILYNDETSESYRDSFTREGWPVEVFVHNLLAQDFFMDDDMHCTMADMIAKSIVIGPDKELAEARKAKARAIIARGPKPLVKDRIDFKRYMITDKLHDLKHPRNADESQALLAELYIQLSDFYLLANGKWSGTGKHLVRRMNAEDPSFQKRFSETFTRAFAGDISGLEPLIKEVLNPFGGLLFEGYKSIAEKGKWAKT